MKQADFLKKRITTSDMVDIQQSMNEAQKSDTPFAVVTKDGVNVVGNPNKTEVKSHDYNIRFRFPKSMAQGIDEKDIVATVGDYVIVNMEFTDVHIKPRNDVDINAAIVKIIPYFKNMTEDLKVEDKTQEELTEIVKAINDDIGQDLYDVVAAVLDIDKSIEDYMLLTDALEVVKRMPTDFPEVFNEADSFFG